jgi:hypothetical protein
MAVGVDEKRDRILLFSSFVSPFAMDLSSFFLASCDAGKKKKRRLADMAGKVRAGNSD